MSRRTYPRDRICCDGLCAQGQPCPALCKARQASMRGVLRLAPGVIDGPHKPAAPRLLLWLK